VCSNIGGKAVLLLNSLLYYEKYGRYMPVTFILIAVSSANMFRFH
jgi:hypothetical protein